MNFLPPVHLSLFPVHGYGGMRRITVNGDRTQCRVYIEGENSAVERGADPFCFAITSEGWSSTSTSVCFVRRNGVDTLLISDYEYARILEISVEGSLLRAIPIDSCACGVAYSNKDKAGGVIAVSLTHTHKVVLLHYESGAVMPEVVMGTGVAGSADGLLNNPLSLIFTADGGFILVADCFNHRVSKFSATTGAFITHMVSRGIRYPCDVLQCDDGSLLVAQESGLADDAGVTLVVDGVIVQTFVFRDDRGLVLEPSLLCQSSSSGDVIVSCHRGSVFLLRDAWVYGSRSAWLGAACIE